MSALGWKEKVEDIECQIHIWGFNTEFRKLVLLKFLKTENLAENVRQFTLDRH